MRACALIVLVMAAASTSVRAVSAVAPTGTSTGKAPVLSGCEFDYPPYCVVNPDNSVTGFSVELLRSALKAMGREVNFRTGTWAEIKQDLSEGHLQALPLVGRTPEREAIFDFTFPYLTMHGTIVIRQETKGIQLPADLAGKKVAVLKGDNAEEYLLRAKLGATILSFDSFETALRELSVGNCDAVVIQKLVALQIIQKNGYSNLATVGPPLDDFKQVFCFATRKGDRDLLAVLNEGLSVVIADGTFRELYATWFSGIETFGQSRSRIVVGGDAQYPPYEYLDENGQPAGLNVDLTRAIAKKLGLDVDIRLGTWDEIRQGLGLGRIDAVQGMFYTPERDRVFGFSPAHTIVNHVIAGRTDRPVPDSMENLAGKSLVVMAGDLMEDLAVKMGYGDNLVRVASQEAALSQLASGKGDYALVAQVPALYWIRRNNWKNLKLSARPVFAAEYCYAFPKESGALRAQFAQGLAAMIATDEYHRIEGKWLAPYTKSGLAAVARYAAFILLALVAVLCVVALWIRSLRKKVELKTAELSMEVAERKRAEAEVRALNRELERRVSERTAELESANTELESFAYAVSHDLRAPLRSMEGFSSIIMNRYDGVLDETGVNYLGRIQSAAVRMGELIEALLGLSRVSRLPLVRKELDLSALAGEIADELLETAGAVVPSIEIKAGMKVDADSALMRILLFNLLDNALKYSAKNAAPRVEFGCAETTGETVFFVKDNGTGFDMAYADRLFIPFQRLHSTKDFPGTGIGLVTVSRIVARHGGRIWPESRPGEGACFFFTLGVSIHS